MLSKRKAAKMLHDKKVHGKPITDKQRRYFAAVAYGQMGGVIDPNGYLESNSDNFTPMKVIPSNNITTEGMAFPIMANGMPLYPNTGEFQFDTPFVVETPMMKKGGMGKYRNYQQGGLTKGLMPSPQYRFEIGNPNKADTMWYDFMFNEMLKRNPVDVSMNKALTSGFPYFKADGTVLEADKMARLKTRQNAYADALSNNLMSDAQVKQELNRPLMLPADTKKYQQGGTTPISEDYYSSSAKLAYYKQLLNEKLKSKNPEAFSNYFSGLSNIRKSGDMSAAEAYVQNTPFEEYLTPDEIRSTLGSEFDNYLQSVNQVNTFNTRQGRQPLFGQLEGNQSLGDLNYGRRFASLMLTPTYASSVEQDPNRTYRREYQYNPATKQVEIIEKGDVSLRPKDFKPVMGQPITGVFMKGGKYRKGCKK